MCGFFCCKCKRSTKKYDEDWESNVNLQNFNPDAHSRPSLEDPHYEESPLKKSAESFQMISTKTFIQETPLTFANPEADSSDEPNIYTAVTERYIVHCKYVPITPNSILGLVVVFVYKTYSIYNANIYVCILF